MTTQASDFRGPSVTFWGAARAVTGSMHLVEAAGRKVLLDCGMVRGRGLRAQPSGPVFPFPPPEIDALVLSHAHIDHCGNLPRLVREGFAGPIYCTAATRELLALVLRDSARIQAEDAHVLNVVGPPDDAGPAPPFTRHDVDRVLAQSIALPYDEPAEIGPDIQVRLVNAGHILGSAMVALTIPGIGREIALTFTGDLGRGGSPLLRDPAPVPAADLLLSESTYGGRTLPSLADTVVALEAVVKRSCERGGKVLIPAFSLGRTQILAYYLQEGMRHGRIPVVPIFVDSPLAADMAEVYHRHRECLNIDYAGIDQSPADGDAEPRHAPIHYVRSADESKELSVRREPCVIIAPGGMCDGGRIVRHLKENVDDPRCSVVLVSYQAPGTLGRRLVQPGASVRIHGRKWNRWADIIELPGFSGHPDRNELLGFLTPLAGRVRKVRLVHGEWEQAEALAGALRQRGFADVAVPAVGEPVSL